MVCRWREALGEGGNTCIFIPCAFQKFLLASFLFSEERSRRKLHFTGGQPETRKLCTQCVWVHVGPVCRPPGHKWSCSPTDAENFHSGQWWLSCFFLRDQGCCRNIPGKDQGWGQVVGSGWGQVERPGMGSGGWGFWSVSALWFIGQVRLSEPELTQEQEGVLGLPSDNLMKPGYRRPVALGWSPVCRNGGGCSSSLALRISFQIWFH